MIRVVVTGAAGRMGGQLVRLIQETAGIALAGAVEREGHPSLGRDAGELAGIGSLGVPVSGSLDALLPTSDVVIDFTSAAASMRHVEAVSRVGGAIVIGSTGFDACERETMRKPAGRARIFQAPNMSLGVNVLLRVVADVARRLGAEYDVEVIETHHRFKKDAPSGTALAFAEAIAGALGCDLGTAAVHGRQGLVGERARGEIGIHAVRAGDVVGDHTVVFGGLGERVEITHKASSRDTFARGAIRAALWLPAQPPGFYEMADLLAF